MPVKAAGPAPEAYPFVRIGPARIDEAMRLYRGLTGVPGCGWNERYPTQELAEADIAAGSLYGLLDAQGSIAALATVSGEPDALEGVAWDSEIRRPCTLSRIAVQRSRLGCGLGGRILRNALQAARDRGFDGARLLVRKDYPSAQHLYKKAGFREVGSVCAHGFDFYCYERRLQPSP